MQPDPSGDSYLQVVDGELDQRHELWPVITSLAGNSDSEGAQDVGHDADDHAVDVLDFTDGG